MKIFKSIKKDAKEMRASILERMAVEQEFQKELRQLVITSRNKTLIDEAKVKFDESVKHWEVLNKSLIEYDKLSRNNWKISPDALLAVAGNLAGILLVLNFEKLDIIRSKAFAMIAKGRP
jgi:hypothetical protein